MLDLVDRGVVAILDFEFVAKHPDGGVEKVALGDLAVPAGVDLSEWEGADSGLLDDSDVAELGAALQPGSVALVTSTRTAGFSAWWTTGGGTGRG